MKIIVLIGMIVIAQSCARQDTFKAILSSPDKFHDREVKVEGLFHDRKNYKAIYLIESDTLNPNGAIAVEFSGIFLLLNTFEGGLDNKRIKIRGTFNKDNKGPTGNFFGTIEEAVLLTDR